VLDMYDVTTSSSTTKTTQLTYADITHPLSASSHIRTHTERKRVMESWPAAMWLHTLSGGLMKLFIRSLFHVFTRLRAERDDRGRALLRGSVA